MPYHPLHGEKEDQSFDQVLRIRDRGACWNDERNLELHDKIRIEEGVL